MQRREPRRAEGDRVAAPNGIVIDAASRQLRSLCSELSNATHAPPLRFLLLYELYSPHLEAYFPRFLASILSSSSSNERGGPVSYLSLLLGTFSQSVRERPTTSSRFKPESSIIPARIVLALFALDLSSTRLFLWIALLSCLAQQLSLLDPCYLFVPNRTSTEMSSVRTFHV